MFEDYFVTTHIIERYQERVPNVSKKEILKRIKKDLHFTKVKKIVNIGNIRHVFTHHSKEFVFEKESNNKWILKTIIKRSRDKNEDAIAQRLAKQEKVNQYVHA